jgi:hypothetical protein
MTGDVQVSQCAGLLESPSAFNTESFAMYCPSGSE